MREYLKDKKRIVIKIGSSSLQHKETGNLDFVKMDLLVRELCNLRNQGKDIVLVTSGAIAVGKKAIPISHVQEEQHATSLKQAYAAVGQARLMTTYQKIFAEYNQVIAQILMTKHTIIDKTSRTNAHNTFSELFQMGVIPVVNENDTVSTDEIEIGDNDTLSAIVTRLVDADLLILLSDIDGLYTDDPRQNKQATFIEQVDQLDDTYMSMGKSTTGSSVGTGGMNTKLVAAKIATSSGADMLIANAEDVKVIHKLISGKSYGTLFKANIDPSFHLSDVLSRLKE